MRLFDFILFIPYVLIVIVIYKAFQKKIQDPELAKYYMWGLYVRIIGVVAVTFIYWYYYGSGDTIVYYIRTIQLKKFLFWYPDSVTRMILGQTSGDLDDAWMYKLFKVSDASSFLIVKIAFFLSFLCFNSFMVISLFFTLYCYYGIWNLYLKVVELFPDVSKKHLAYAVLFIPNVFFWGSGLFKDTITLGAVCVIIYSFHNVFILRSKVFVGIINIVISAYLIGVIKSYLLLAMIPALLMWYVYSFRNKIKSTFLRTFLTPILLFFSVIVGFFMLQQLGKVFTKFNLENIEQKAEGMQRWHTVRGEQKEESSVYSLGDVEFNATGILKKIPAALNVSYFRPYLWEASNPVMFAAALESLVFFILTLVLFLKHFRLLSFNIRSEPFLIFCLIYVFIVGFSVGLTAYNFGALVRYKIPALPLYGIILAVVYSRIPPKKSKESKVVQQLS